MAIYINSTTHPSSITTNTIQAPSGSTAMLFSGSTVIMSGSLNVVNTTYLTNVSVSGDLGIDTIRATNMYVDTASVASTVTAPNFIGTASVASAVTQLSQSVTITGSIILKNITAPTPVAGGIYFDGTSFYLGI